MKIVRLLIGGLATAATAATAAIAQPPPAVPGEPALVPRPQTAPQLRLLAKSAKARLTFPPVTEREVERVREENRRNVHKSRIAVGVNRGVPARDLAPSSRNIEWTPVPGGFAAQVSVTSPRAGSMRVAVNLAGAPENAQVLVFGSADPARLTGPIRVGDIPGRTLPWWSPITEGETQTLEFFVPGLGDPRSSGWTILAASHVFSSPSAGFAKRTQDIGTAGACNVDVACTSVAGTAFQNVASAVAQMVFTDGTFTALCTGTLLNDTDASTQIPWFFTANHCFDNPAEPYKSREGMQAVANSLNTLWRFEAEGCGSETVKSSWTQLTGGATFVQNDPASDILLLRLNNPAPAGSFFAGWDANPVGAGASIVGIHHPRGDLKKVSQGSVVGFGAPRVSGAFTSYIQARWSSGTTEGGSSGSGLFTFNGTQYMLRGGLWGGSATCGDASGTDFYSRFDQAYPALAAYLTPRNAPLANFTDLWWDSRESGWGLNLTQHASGALFGVWYTYGVDGKPLWVVMPTGSWSSPSVFSGPLYITSGPPPTTPFDPSLVTQDVVGTGTLSFRDANNGTWSYTINGVSGSKSITRQPF